MRGRPTLPSSAYHAGDKRRLVGDPLDWIIGDRRRASQQQLHRVRSEVHVSSPAADTCRASDADDSLSMLLPHLPQLLDDLAMSSQVARLHESNARGVAGLLDAQGSGA